jgi:hypothetical protein
VLQAVSSVTNKSVIPEVFYRESIAEYGFPIKDFGNDERLVGYNIRVVTLGGCPRIEAVARKSGIESIFSIKWGEYLLYLTNLIGKMGQNPLFRSRFLFSDSLLV